MFSMRPKQSGQISTQHRMISTAIPAPGTEEEISRGALVESRSMHGQLPIVWQSAEDYYVFDIAGNQFLDMTSTIFVTNVGHSNPNVARAVEQALSEKLISTYAYANKPKLSYLEKLLTFAGEGFEKAFLMSSGTEASEAILKLMRLDAQSKQRGSGIITFEGNWHGRTLGAQMLSSNTAQSAWINSLDKEIFHLPFPLPWKVSEEKGEDFFLEGIRKLRSSGIDPASDLAGIYLETFQGWGALFYPTSFVQAAEQFCRANDIVFAFDEMQAGFGRTGMNFGFMHYGVIPDLIAVGKGMGNGLPVSGVLGRADLLDLPSVGNMSSTHSGNPLVCAAGEAVLDELSRLNLVAETARKGEILHQELKLLEAELPEVRLTTGKGLVAAILLSPTCSPSAAAFATAVVERCMQLGLLVVHTGREAIKIGPPLTITDDAIREAVETIREAFIDVRNGL